MSSAVWDLKQESVPTGQSPNRMSPNSLRCKAGKNPNNPSGNYSQLTLTRQGMMRMQEMAKKVFIVSEFFQDYVKLGGYSPIYGTPQ